MFITWTVILLAIAFVACAIIKVRKLCQEHAHQRNRDRSKYILTEFDIIDDESVNEVH